MPAKTPISGLNPLNDFQRVIGHARKELSRLTSLRRPTLAPAIILQGLKSAEWIERNLLVEDRDSGVIQPFTLWEPQREISEYFDECERDKKSASAIIYKPRKIGISTYGTAEMSRRSMSTCNFKGVILADDDDHSVEMFEKCAFFHEQLDPTIKPELLSSTEHRLKFGDVTVNGITYRLQSRLLCKTARTKTATRSTDRHAVWASEVAFYTSKTDTEQARRKVNDMLIGMFNSVPQNHPGTLVVEESTPNGRQGPFYDDWKAARRGESRFRPFAFFWQNIKEFRERNVSADDVLHWKLITSYVDRYGELPLHPPGGQLARAIMEIDPKPDEIVLFKRFNLSWNQIAWRRRILRDNCKSDPAQFSQEYPCDEESGFISTAEGLFDPTLLSIMKDNCTAPARVGMLNNALPNYTATSIY